MRRLLALVLIVAGSLAIWSGGHAGRDASACVLELVGGSVGAFGATMLLPQIERQ